MMFSAIGFGLFLCRKDGIETINKASAEIAKQNLIMSYITCCLLVFYFPLTIPQSIIKIIKENN